MCAQDYDIGRMLEEMRADYWRNLETADSDDLVDATDYLVVAFDDQRYAFPAAACREVLKVPRLIKVPRLPRHLLGIVNLRGEIIAVTDLRPFFQRPEQPTTASSRLVIVEANALKTALLVDRVDGLISIADAAVEPLAQGAAQESRDLVRGKVAQEDGLLLLIDLGGLMNRPEMVVDQKGRQAMPTSAESAEENGEELP